jgi:DNA-binding response OmpR family regulator
MTCMEAYKEHIMYTFNGFCKTVIRYAAINAWRDRTLIFPGLEIRLHQRRVLKNGSDINLTRLEFGALCCLAASLHT